jgi:hypothetical protein
MSNSRLCVPHGKNHPELPKFPQRCTFAIELQRVRGVRALKSLALVFLEALSEPSQLVLSC